MAINKVFVTSEVFNCKLYKQFLTHKLLFNSLILFEEAICNMHNKFSSLTFLSSTDLSGKMKFLSIWSCYSSEKLYDFA